MDTYSRAELETRHQIAVEGAALYAGYAMDATFSEEHANWAQMALAQERLAIETGRALMELGCEECGSSTGCPECWIAGVDYDAPCDGCPEGCQGCEFGPIVDAEWVAECWDCGGDEGECRCVFELVDACTSVAHELADAEDAVRDLAPGALPELVAARHLMEDLTGELWATRW